MGCTRDSQRSWYNHARSRRICFWNGYDRGRSSCFAIPGVGDRGSPDIGMVPQAFTGRPPFSEFTAPVITSRIIDGKRPARPQEAQKLGLTDSVWDTTVRCWHQDPIQRPTMMEVVRVLREWSAFSPPRNQHRDMLPAATGRLLGLGLKSQISQPNS